MKSSGYVSFNFVKVELDPFSCINSCLVDRMETSHVRNSCCPVFNDVITINIHPEELKQQTLICSVYDENRISPKDLIGAVVLDLSEVFKQINGKEENFNEKLQWIKGVCNNYYLILLHALDGYFMIFFTACYMHVNN